MDEGGRSATSLAAEVSAVPLSDEPTAGAQSQTGAGCDAATGESRTLEIAVSWRNPAEVFVQAPLARALLAATPLRPLARLRRKAIRTLFHVVHQRLGMPARAIMCVVDGSIVKVDAANTGFLDYAARNQRGDGCEPEVSGLLVGLAAQLRVVYDVGANWGYYPLLLGTEPRFQGTIHAFEINPRTAADLRGIVVGAGLTRRVAVHDFGLSDRNGEARLSREKHSFLSRIVDPDDRRPADVVRVRRLDDLGLPPPDLIKIDVEGHEAGVLAGAKGTLVRDQPLVIIESWYQPERVGAMLAPLRLLAELGYRLHRLIWRPMPESADGPAVRRGTLLLIPLTPSDRPAIHEPLNLLAVPPRRSAWFAGDARARQPQRETAGVRAAIGC